MSVRRPLGQTLGEIAGSVLALDGLAAKLVQVGSIELDLPIELRLGSAATGHELVGDLPLFRIRTDFDWPPARLHARFEAVPVELVPVEVGP